MSKVRLAFTLFLICMGIQARATSLGLDLSQGSQTQSTEISGSGDFNDNDDKEEPQTVYDWNLSAIRSLSEVKDTSGVTIHDTTTDLVAGLGLETPSKLTFGLDLNYSSTPEEN